MKVTALTALMYFFSVLNRIQSEEIVHVFNYDNFDELFHQGDRDDFNKDLYEYINIIFDKPYEGPNIGGAFVLHGTSRTARQFDGYIVDITASFYCGNKETDNLEFLVYYADNAEDHYFCGDSNHGWNYNYTWTPPTHFNHAENFSVEICAYNAVVNQAFGFDEIRITTTDRPPHLLTATNPATAPTITP